MAVQRNEAKDERPPVQVIATARGHCGVAIREPGDVFTVPASMFDERPKFGADKKPTGEMYPAPTWFEEAVEAPVAETRVVGRSQVKRANNDGRDLA